MSSTLLMQSICGKVIHSNKIFDFLMHVLCTHVSIHLIVNEMDQLLNNVLCTVTHHSSHIPSKEFIYHAGNKLYVIKVHLC